MTLETLIAEARRLPAVPVGAISEYYDKMSPCLAAVDAALAGRDDISALIGNNPLQLIYDNHRHHATFMVTVFSIGNYELLARTLPWVYRTYRAHGFAYDYFQVELQAWLNAFHSHTDFAKMGEVARIYSWMMSRHEEIMALSREEVDLGLVIDEKWLPRKNSFLTAILQGEHHLCLDIVQEAVAAGDSSADIYQQIIQPVMYEIGLLWENNTISVAQEHLASAIVGRVLTSLSISAPPGKRHSGRIVVTAASNEYHEIGAWMVSDVLEQEGWQVRYLGANTPAGDLLQLIRDFRPEALVISVTMPFNILQAKEAIAMLRADGELDHVRVMVGGQAFRGTPELWRDTGADGYGGSVSEATQLLASWRAGG